MLGPKPPLSTEEKLDAVYQMLRRAERAHRLSLIFRLLFIGIVVYCSYSLAFDPRTQDHLEDLFDEHVVPRISEMAGHMAERMQADIVESSIQRDTESQANGTQASTLE
ncbi:MAG TPA: hypothetical protein PK765_01110 [bacterium]|nr:hypothetical protein [bacterium]